MLGNEAHAADVIRFSVANLRTVTVNGSWIDCRQYEGDIVVVQEVGVVAGTSPTLDGKLMDATDGSGTGAADLAGATFTQATAAGVQKLVIPAGSHRGWLRYTGTIGGTSPQFQMAVIGLSRPKIV